MKTTYAGLPGIPHGKYDGPRIRCTAREFSGMALAGRLYHACQGKLGREMEQRLRQTPGAWRNWRAACAMMGRAMDAIYNTVPDDQFERLWAIFTQGNIDINMPRACDFGGELVVVHGEALRALTRAAMEGQCTICLREGGHARSCPTARALAGCVEPDTWDTCGCVWRDQALRDREQSK